MDIKDKNGNILAKSIVSNQHNVEKNFHTKNDEELQVANFMLQKEVVDRMIANPNTKTYGRLSIMTQVYFQATKLFDISENVFVPKPKVKSSFIRLLPKEYIFDNKNHENIFYKIVKKAFEGRRKMIRTSLGEYFEEKDYDIIKIDSKKRPENLSIKDYLLLSRYVYKN